MPKPNLQTRSCFIFFGPRCNYFSQSFLRRGQKKQKGTPRTYWVNLRIGLLLPDVRKLRRVLRISTPSAVQLNSNPGRKMHKNESTRGAAEVRATQAYVHILRPNSYCTYILYNTVSSGHHEVPHKRSGYVTFSHFCFFYYVSFFIYLNNT